MTSGDQREVSKFAKAPPSVGGVDISYRELVVSVSAWSPYPCAIASTRLTLRCPRRDSETTGTARRQALGRTARHGQLTGISLEPREP
ncbi:hypothetical protein Trydic_g23665 [Trypoxylus dichotomus]